MTIFGEELRRMAGVSQTTKLFSWLLNETKNQPRGSFVKTVDFILKSPNFTALVENILKQIEMFRDPMDAAMGGYKLSKVLEYAIYGTSGVIDYPQLADLLGIDIIKTTERGIVDNGLERYLRELGFVNNKWIQG